MSSPPTGPAPSRPPAATAAAAAPRVWSLIGEKAGDNALVRVVTDALGWPVAERRIAMRARWARGKPFVRASLHHVDRERSDRLEPPWPDLVITIGRRLSMVALWIRAQSGGRTRIALLNVPRRRARDFDLIVASAQYRDPRRANVVRLGLPLVRVDRAAVDAAADAWRAQLADLPRPLTALFVGGPTKPVIFDAAVARDLAAAAAKVVAQSGGSLFVSTSRRTPPEVADALAAALPPDSARIYRWRADAQENPYLALLGVADGFIVTSDSITMMVEVARLGRPLAVYELPPARGAFWRSWSARDLSAVPRLLLVEGFATPLGMPLRRPAAPPPDDLARVVARIRALC